MGQLHDSSLASQHWTVTQIFPREGDLEQRVLGDGVLGGWDLGGPAATGGGGWVERERQAEAMLPSPGPTCLAQPPLASHQDQNPPEEPPL